MADLVSWLSARYDEAERAAEAATPGPWRHSPDKHWRKPGTAWFEEAVFAGPSGADAVCVAGTGKTDDPQSMADAAYIAAHDPSWRLADIGRKRAILAEHPAAEGWNYDTLGDRVCGRCCGEDSAGGRVGDDPYPCRTLRLLAAEFAGQPGYDEAWRPE